MLIRGDDRVSTVLRANEDLIDVFVGLSPAFERLRNPGVRKVMSRLVTVEQAARMAGVDPAELLARLNEDTSGQAEVEAVASPPGRPAPDDAPSVGTEGLAEEDAPAADRPSILEGVPDGDIIRLDVREDLRNGREPFSRIMAARRELPPGGVLCLRVIFEPVPLYAVMEKQGLAHSTRQLGPEDWRVWFYEARPENRPPGDAGGGAGSEATTEGPVTRPEAGAVRVPDASNDTVVLDVRGLDPPEPMVRTLEALEELPPDGTLVQINVRVPQFLLPRLRERGFDYEVQEQAPDVVRVFIRRAPGS